MPIPVVILIAVLLLIAVRRLGNLRIGMWQSMTAGAVAMLVLGEISPSEALASINVDVIVFLAGMFVVGTALEESGYLAHISYAFIKRAQTRNTLLLLLLTAAAGMSAVLMNDTLAIIGVPVVLHLARKHDISPKPLLLGLCFAVTIGSVFSPIGNPQNLLIALSGVFDAPFLSFFRTLFIPSAANLLVCYWMLRLLYPDHVHEAELSHSQEPIKDPSLARLSRLSLILIVALIVVKIVVVSAGGTGYPLTMIAVIAAVPVLIRSPRRWELLYRSDWKTLLFFASMFVVMESVWKTGFLQQLLSSAAIDLHQPASLLLVSVVLSQFISNVPLVALLQPVLLHAGAGESVLLVLAAGSTIAGNLFIFGAASNVIVLQNAEARSGPHISFWEFARIGIPLTVLNALVYYAAFALF